MLVFPSNLQVYQPSDVNSPDGLFAYGVQYGSPETIPGTITPLSAEASFKETGIALSRPHLLIVECGYADKIGVTTLIIWGTRQFKVSKPCSLFAFGTPADHASTVLEELEHANY